MTPRYKWGNIWDVLPTPGCDYLGVTTNGVLNSHNKLIMGAGIARQAKDKFPLLAERWGEELNKLHKIQHPNASGHRPMLYGVIHTPIHIRPFSDGYINKLFALQTKLDYRRKSTLELVEYSILEMLNVLPTGNIHIPMPGVGLGGLDKQQVKNLLDAKLPERVTVWDYAT